MLCLLGHPFCRANPLIGVSACLFTDLEHLCCAGVHSCEAIIHLFPDFMPLYSVTKHFFTGAKRLFGVAISLFVESM
jgi:hypothetical protein